MILYSLTFFGFFAVFSGLLQLVRDSRKQIFVFLLANVAFYAYWDYRFLAILFGLITVTYGCAWQFARTGKNGWIALGAVVGLLALGIFKYFNFFVTTFADAFGIQDPLTLKLVLPLGISFYTFQMLSYLFDLQKGRIAFDKSYWKLAAYISFFPQITSGPIVKARDFLPQLEKSHRLKKENFYQGLQLFLTGLTKKIVFADRIGVAVDAVFAAPKAYNGTSLLLAVIGYSLQIYCDFSGYSDMAIGVAKIWDFDLGANFNAPYLATNPSDFWSRWHISLSSWFKEYVYIPLGGNRKGRMRTYLNLFVTMLLSGLWHGANVTFLLWGAMHGLASVIHKLVFPKKRQTTGLTNGILTLTNCSFVALTWIVFRAESLSAAGEVFRGLFRTSGILYVNVYVVCYGVLLGGIFAWSKFKNQGNILKINWNLDRFIGKVFVAAWIFAIITLMYVGNSAFIYAQF